MPLYTYESVRSRRRIVRMVTIEKRDKQRGWRRVFEPCRPHPPVTDRPSLQTRQVLDGYKKLEERGELHRSQFKASQVKDIWSRPDAPEPQETAA